MSSQVCAQPFCAPVHHCFGCGSHVMLKRSIVLILLIDFMYGVAMVVVHAVLIGRADQRLFDAPPHTSVAVHGNTVAFWSAAVYIGIGVCLCLGLLLCSLSPCHALFMCVCLILCFCVMPIVLAWGQGSEGTSKVSYKHVQMASPLVFHRGEDCWSSCGDRSGACQWCGPGNACCRKGVHMTSVQDICYTAAGFQRDGDAYECVRPAVDVRLLWDSDTLPSPALPAAPALPPAGTLTEVPDGPDMPAAPASPSPSDKTSPSNGDGPNPNPNGELHDGDPPHWLIQVADLDLSWGHFLLGFSDGACLFAGMFYGLVVVSCSACAWDVGIQGCGHVVHPWFLTFARLQFIVYLCQSALKYQHACDLQQEYFPALETTCDSLRFSFVQRMVIGSFLAIFGLWTLESFMVSIHEDNERPFMPTRVHTRDLSNVHGPVMERLSGSSRWYIPSVHGWHAPFPQQRVMYQQVPTEPPPLIDCQQLLKANEPSTTEALQILVDDSVV